MAEIIEIAEDKIDCISPQQAWRYRILPIEWTDGQARFYHDSEGNEDLKEELQILFGKEVLFDLLDSNALNKSLGKYYRTTEDSSNSLSSISARTENVIEKIIREAHALGSSDIHIEYYEGKARVRYRIDGKLIHRFNVDQTSYKAITNQIKLKAGANLAEVRLPQDGRLDIRDLDISTDIRASILPTHGAHEKVVLRILGGEAGDVSLEELGFEEQQLKDFKEGISKPNGIVLISGPTGSGKTTTLYATLRLLNKDSVNITTIENPVEYVMDGINQVQLNEGIGLTFAEALKTFLRQDPDIIMVGEIRDQETAEMAVRASLTGHLVFSTIHTNSAWGTVSRLMDMGVPSYLLADTVNTTVAQRLVRLLCDNCKTEDVIDKSELPSQYHNKIKFNTSFHPQGCELCHYTGYKGRTAIYEVIRIDDGLKQIIKGNGGNVGDYLGKKGVKTLSDNVLTLVETGKTSIEEAYPVLLTF